MSERVSAYSHAWTEWQGGNGRTSAPEAGTTEADNRALLCSPTLQGDNDPVDVVEIGSATHRQGGVYKVRVLSRVRVRLRVTTPSRP